MTLPARHCGTCKHVMAHDDQPPPPRDVVAGRTYQAGCAHPDHRVGTYCVHTQHAERMDLPICTGFEAAL